MQKYKFTRTNFQIRASVVRLTQDGRQLGVVPIDAARKMAQEQGLDLVETVPNAHPPVCAIMDFGKFKFDQKIREKENRRRQRETTVQIKELRLRPGISDHDIITKINQARRFLEEGKKVQIVLSFKNRELSHKEVGFRVINKFIEEVKNIANVESAPRMEGSKLLCRLTPSKS